MKRPTDLLLQRVQQTTDKVYSIQKSTFKGWAAFYKQLSSVVREYSSELLKLSQNGGDYIGLKHPLPQCMELENPTMRSIMAEALHSVSVLSQMQYNFSQRLQQLSETHLQMYSQAKRTKDHFTQSLQTAYPRDLSRTTPRITAQRRVCQGLHEITDRMQQDQITRIQKIRQNCIIFYSMARQIHEKQKEEVANNGARLSKMEIESTRKDLTKLVNDTAELYNSMLGPEEVKIQKKQDKMAQTMRASLKMTKTNSNKEIKMERGKNALKEIQRVCEEEIKQVIGELNQKYENRKGVLSREMGSYYKVSYYVKPELINSFVYSMLESYYFQKLNEPETKANLTSIKVRLKLATNHKLVFNQTRNFKQYLQLQFDSRPEPQRRCILQLISFSMYHACLISQDQLLISLQKSLTGPCTTNEIPNIDFKFDIWINAVFIEVLLQTLFRSRDRQEFLIDNYVQVFQVINRFGKEYFGVEQQLTLIVFLNRVVEDSEWRDEHQVQPNIRELQKLMQIQDYNPDLLSDLTFHSRGHLKNTLCCKLLNIYQPNTHTSLLVQTLQWIDIYFKSNFALETIFNCLKLSGYRYLREKDPDRSLFGNVWEPKEKIRMLSEIVRNNQFLLIDEKILLPLSNNIGNFYGIAVENVRKRVRQAFFHIISQTILQNTKTIDPQGLQDPDGHLLRLGIQLCKLDQFSPQSLISYNSYFQLLNIALISMQKQYKDLLQQTKTTQLWTVEQDMYATRNCHDFCSLLAKPIEFMANILRETMVVVDGNASEFRSRFVLVVKLKLNEILKVEVVKYFVFLEASLKRVVVGNEPRVTIDGKKVEQPQIPTPEQTKQNHLSFKQYCRRLNNLLFVKQQINLIVKDILDQQLSDLDIFQKQRLDLQIGKAGENSRELLTILRKISQDIVTIQKRTVQKLAKATVYYYLRRLFERVYYRVEKGAFDELFGSNDVKLSEHTLMANKQQIEQYVELIRRSVPSEYLQLFFSIFFRALYQSTKHQILNAHKFRVPLSGEILHNYLNTDIANLTTHLKKLQCFNEDLIHKYYYQPIRRVLEDLKQEPLTLCTRFEQATMNKRKDDAEEILAVLNLRCMEKDRKVKEFVKKYRGSLNK